MLNSSLSGEKPLLPVEDTIRIAESTDPLRVVLNGLSPYYIMRQRDADGRNGTLDPIYYATAERILEEMIPGVVESIRTTGTRGVLSVLPADLEPLGIDNDGEPLPIESDFSQLHLSVLRTKKPYAITDIRFDSRGTSLDGEPVVYNNRIFSVTERQHSSYAPGIE